VSSPHSPSKELTFEELPLFTLLSETIFCTGEPTKGDGMADDTIAKHFNIWDPALADDPHATLAELRRQCPVAWTEEWGGHWFVSSYEETHEVVSDYKRFSSREVTVPNTPFPDGPQLPIQYDPPAHTAYRHVIAPGFSPKRVAEEEPAVRTLARQLFGAIVEKGSSNFLTDFALPLPSITVLRLLGFPVEDMEKLMQFKYEMLINLYSEDEVVRNRVQNEVRPEFNAYVKTHLDARRQMENPPDDAMSSMLFGQLEGHEKMTDGEIARACMLLLTAGLDTVTQTMMLMFEYLAKNPDIRHQLKDKDIIPSAVEEFLRYFSIVTLARQCTEDTVLGGRQIKANQMVQVSPPSAGRDGKEFPNPDVIDLRRSPNRHLAFGGGPHRCPGSHLARMELRVTLEEMVDIMPDFELAPGFVAPRRFGVIMGIDALELVIPSKQG